jgi:tetratricopeptide (TPR) repeat protein
MAASISLSRFFICFCIISIFSCHKKPALKNIDQANQPEVERLITRGKNLENSRTDSLVPIAKSLLHIANRTGNKTALIYGELFTTHYEWQLANHEEATKMAVKCLSDAEKWNIQTAYPEIYRLISNLHKESTNYKMAFDAAEKGLTWAETNRDTASIIALLNLKAMLIHTRTLAVNSSFKNDSSIRILLDVLKIAESNVKFESLCIPFYDNISQYYLDNKNYNEAINYANKGVILALKYNQPRSLTYSYCWLGNAYYFKGDKLKGLAYLNKALRIARSVNEPYRVMEIYEHLYNCYYLSGNYKKAIALTTLSRKMRDSLQVRVNEKQISELQIRYETAEKDKKIILMDQAGKIKNQQILAIQAIAILFLAFSIILFLQYRLLSRSNRLIRMSNSKKDLALENIAFIQSHELRKPLASILGLINVIKVMDHQVDETCLINLEDAAKELDVKIHAVVSHVENEAICVGDANKCYAN